MKFPAVVRFNVYNFDKVVVVVEISGCARALLSTIGLSANNKKN